MILYRESLTILFPGAKKCWKPLLLDRAEVPYAEKKERKKERKKGKEKKGKDGRAWQWERGKR